jgi:predicted GTPase
LPTAASARRAAAGRRQRPLAGVRPRHARLVARLGGAVRLVYTKADRTKRGPLAAKTQELRTLLPWREDATILATSAKENEGIVGVRKWLEAVLAQNSAAEFRAEDVLNSANGIQDMKEGQRDAAGGSSNSA